MKALISVLCVLCLCTVPAFAGESFETLIDNASSYSEEDRDYLLYRVGDIYNELSSGGLPTEPVIRKLQEGLRKNILPYNIVQTLEIKQSSLVEASTILREIDVDAGDDESLLTNLALSLEYSVPPEIVKEALQESVVNDGHRVHLMVESLSAFLEYGVPPQRAGSLIREFSRKSPSRQDMQRITRLFERARREGVDLQRTAEALEGALSRYGSLNMVELEVQSFISDVRSRPSLSSGQGSITTEPGISSGGTPTQEGGTPIDTSPPAGTSPTQETGTELD